jgi:hypothetical protein
MDIMDSLSSFMTEVLFPVIYSWEAVILVFLGIVLSLDYKDMSRKRAEEVQSAVFTSNNTEMLGILSVQVMLKLRELYKIKIALILIIAILLLKL